MFALNHRLRYRYSYYSCVHNISAIPMLYIRDKVLDKDIVNKYNFNSTILPQMNIVCHTTTPHLAGSVLKFNCLKLKHAEKICAPNCDNVYRQPRILLSIVRIEKHRNIRKLAMLHGRKEKAFISFLFIKLFKDITFKGRGRNFSMVMRKTNSEIVRLVKMDYDCIQ